MAKCSFMRYTRFAFRGSGYRGTRGASEVALVPVQAKRYEIVTKAGVLSTQPPLAVIYLEGNFPRPASLPTKEVEQKDLTFIPALLPIEVGTKIQFPTLDDQITTFFPIRRSSDLISAVIARRNGRYLR